jgi:3-hydroxyanthranilate 3,4-dioxygenase
MASYVASFNQVVNFPAWTAQRQAEGNLAPPVCNAMLSCDGTLILMLLGGPNQREDYHINQGEELFYMIKGDMNLKLMECGTPRDCIIREGEFFILPGGIPHSPQRFPDTLGLVVERGRNSTELDGLRYYCDPTTNKDVLWERWFHCRELGSALPPLIRSFMESEERATRRPTAPIGEAPMPVDVTTLVKAPTPLDSLYASIKPGDWPKELVHKEFSTNLVTNESTAPTLPIETTCWVWVLEGQVRVNDALTLSTGDCVTVPSLTAWHHEAAQHMRAMLVYTTVALLS